MFPPDFAGDRRHRPDFAPLPAWFMADMGARICTPPRKRRWRLPIWPGFRLEISITALKGVEHV